MKTAFLLGSIGSGISLLLKVYNLIEYILNGSDYITPGHYLYASANIVAYALLTACFIIAYQKQNSRSWKD